METLHLQQWYSVGGERVKLLSVRGGGWKELESEDGTRQTLRVKASDFEEVGGDDENSPPSSSAVPSSDFTFTFCKENTTPLTSAPLPFAKVNPTTPATTFNDFSLPSTFSSNTFASSQDFSFSCSDGTISTSSTSSSTASTPFAFALDTEALGAFAVDYSASSKPAEPAPLKQVETDATAETMSHFSCRAKVFQFNAQRKSWEIVGLGSLVVATNTDSEKSSVGLSLENGRVVFNAGIYDGMAPKQPQPKQVLLSAINCAVPGNDVMGTYMLRFGSEENAEKCFECISSLSLSA